MGYTTEFEGEFKLDKPLTVEQAAYLNKFSDTRRMKRHAHITESFPDKWRNDVGLPIGKEGCYYVGSIGEYGQRHDESIIDYNNPPFGQPGLWCQWVVNKDKTAIHWDGGEKFYYYDEWIQYIIEHFLIPWGYTLNGVVKYSGEDLDDHGKIVIINNKVDKINSIFRG